MISVASPLVLGVRRSDARSGRAGVVRTRPAFDGKANGGLGYRGQELLDHDSVYTKYTVEGV